MKEQPAMPRVENIRSQILSLLRAAPFQKFVVNMENGDRVLIEHPENIALDPKPNSRNTEFSVVTGKVRMFGSFDAVTSLVKADRDGATS
jgi:hypothetical protein